MPIPTPPTRLEETFQPILPKVDHILALMREHQARTSAGDDQDQGLGQGLGSGNLSGTEKRSGNGKDGDGGLVDLEDKIIKEASSTRLLLNLQKSTAHSLPGGHLSLRQVDEGLQKTEKDIHRDREILERFDERIEEAGVISPTAEEGSGSV